MNENIYPRTLEFYWSRIQFPGNVQTIYNANAKNLLKYYEIALKNIHSRFRLQKFESTSGDFGQGIKTFVDGVYQFDDGSSCCYWCLPWFGYSVSVGDMKNPSLQTISSIVENAMILLWLNGISLWQCLKPSTSPDNLLGYDITALVSYSRHLLATCCFFYGKHIKYSKNKLKVEDFLKMCTMDMFERLTVSNDANYNKNGILISVVERNKINFKAKFGHGKKDTPIRVTIGGKDRRENHSISMTKYGVDVDRQILRLSYEYSVREITKILNEEGISISKSTVERRIQRIKASKNYGAISHVDEVLSQL